MMDLVRYFAVTELSGKAYGNRPQMLVIVSCMAERSVDMSRKGDRVP